MENQADMQETQTIENTGPNVRSLIFGIGDYEPTLLQSQLILEYITDEEARTPPQILRAMGKAPESWWQWPKRHPGFLKWWNAIVEHVFAEHRLNDLYNSLYKRGRMQDTAAAKIVIQRFDPRFTERNQTDSRHSFAGYEPAAAARSEERQRKALAEQVQGPQIASGSTIDALPIPEQPPIEAPIEPNGPVDAITGVDQPCAPNTHAIQAQSQSNEHEQAGQAGNDHTPDTEQETRVDPPGVGL